MIGRAAALLIVGVTVHAQSIPGAVLATHEPHHHLAYEDTSLRVLRVRVPAHDSTLLHEHDPDYFWISLGPSTLINAKPGVADATITSADLSFHYSFGNFAHIARNPGERPFDNITVELLRPQTNVRNLCERVIADQPLDCPAPPPTSRVAFSGANVHPAFASGQTRVSLVTIAPGGVMKPVAGSRDTWIIALDSAIAGRSLVFKDGTKWIGGTAQPPAGNSWILENRGKTVVRAIAVEKL